MLDELRAMAVFAKTVELGSFRAAAAALGLAPSVVSHHISQLEKRLGAALLYRSTRRLSLTAAGEQLFEATQAMLHAASVGLDAIAAQTQAPVGRLRVTLPAFFAPSKVLDAIAAFAQQYPKVSLSMQFSDAKQDLVKDGLDLAIRVGALADSALKSRQLFTMRRVLVASPAYLQHRPAPTHPEALQDWDWIGLSIRANRKQWRSPAGEAAELGFAPRIVVDSLAAVCALARAGMGLATPPRFMVEQDLLAGGLIEVLPDWQVTPLDVFAVWPGNAPAHGLTQRLVTFLYDQSASIEGEHRRESW
ncbi:DNA-binding transcriptional LysR family regulator [Chitinivorax tropicus]|uniref:DNA-binding transcriptional LysR family regulator n=1 Tax=Chitinivorax tropicus TaxID=714531 RepID=A0A840MDT6_9PROT|nr:LysR family transcriptional regulator [Chitinivorax tropicus]MBB5016838.1 DNA-binding transcriptional LysR family regulator [Chitinivorax tropicus]